MPLTVATWNLDNFQHSAETPVSFRKKIYNKKLDYIENIIVNKLKLPDIIAFQEILGPTQIINNLEIGVGAQRDMPLCLQDLEKILQKSGFYKCYFSNYKERGKRIALFSKIKDVDDMKNYDQLGPESHASFPWTEISLQNSKLKVYEFGEANSRYEDIEKFTCPPMSICVSLNNIKINVLAVHLRSKKPSYDFVDPYPNMSGNNRNRHQTPTSRAEEARGLMRSLMIRSREICQLRNIMDENLLKYSNIIVLGDLCDDTYSVTTQMLEGINNNNFSKPQETNNSNQSILNITSLFKSEKRFSHIYKNIKQQYDHILVSKNLMPSNSENIFVFNEDIEKKSIVPEGYEYVPDHAPVMALLEI